MLLELVLTVITSRRTKQEMAKLGITPVHRAGEYFRILFIALYFSMDCSYVLQEFKQRPSLRRFAHVSEVPTPHQFYRFMSRFDESSCILLTTRILSTLCKKRNPKRKATLLVDSTSISLDLNWFRRHYTKQNLEDKEFAWGYSPTHGHYIGYKLTLVINYPALTPLAMRIHRGSPNDSTIFTEIMNDLSRRRIIREGDILVFDKEYYFYQYYADGICKFKVIPLIFPRKNFKKSKLLSKFVIPLPEFSRSRIKQDIQVWKQLLDKLLTLFDQVDEYTSLRSLIEDVFKVAKNALSLKRLHRYTTRSVEKMVAASVLLLGTIISSHIPQVVIQK